MKHCMMFDDRSNEVAAFWLEQARRPKNSEVGAFSAAAGEDYFTRFATEHRGRPFACLVEHRSRASADMVHTGRITPYLVEVRQHGFTHLRVKRRGRVVIEINRSHPEPA